MNVFLNFKFANYKSPYQQLDDFRSYYLFVLQGFCDFEDLLNVIIGVDFLNKYDIKSWFYDIESHRIIINITNTDIDGYWFGYVSRYTGWRYNHFCVDYRNSFTYYIQDKNLDKNQIDKIRKYLVDNIRAKVVKND